MNILVGLTLLALPLAEAHRIYGPLSNMQIDKLKWEMIEMKRGRPLANNPGEENGGPRSVENEADYWLPDCNTRECYLASHFTIFGENPEPGGKKCRGK